MQKHEMPFGNSGERRLLERISPYNSTPHRKEGRIPILSKKRFKPTRTNAGFSV